MRDKSGSRLAIIAIVIALVNCENDIPEDVELNVDSENVNVADSNSDKSGKLQYNDEFYGALDYFPEYSSYDYGE